MHRWHLACQILGAMDIHSCATDLASTSWRERARWRKNVAFAICPMWSLQNLTCGSANFLQLFQNPLCWQPSCRIFNNACKIMVFTKQWRLWRWLRESLSLRPFSFPMKMQSFQERSWRGFRKCWNQYLSLLWLVQRRPNTSKEPSPNTFEKPWESSERISPGPVRKQSRSEGYCISFLVLFCSAMYDGRRIFPRSNLGCQAMLWRWVASCGGKLPVELFESFWAILLYTVPWQRARALVRICSKAIEQSALCGADCNVVIPPLLFLHLVVFFNQDAPYFACSTTSGHFAGKELPIIENWRIKKLVAVAAIQGHGAELLKFHAVSLKDGVTIHDAFINELIWINQLRWTLAGPQHESEPGQVDNHGPWDQHRKAYMPFANQHKRNIARHMFWYVIEINHMSPELLTCYFHIYIYIHTYIYKYRFHPWMLFQNF